MHNHYDVQINRRRFPLPDDASEASREIRNAIADINNVGSVYKSLYKEILNNFKRASVLKNHGIIFYFRGMNSSSVFSNCIIYREMDGSIHLYSINNDEFISIPSSAFQLMRVLSDSDSAQTLTKEQFKRASKYLFRAYCLRYPEFSHFESMHRPERRIAECKSKLLEIRKIGDFENILQKFRDAGFFIANSGGCSATFKINFDGFTFANFFFCPLPVEIILKINFAAVTYSASAKPLIVASEYWHPHVSPAGKDVCFGTFKAQFREAIMEQDPDFIKVILIQILNSYNPVSPYFRVSGNLQMPMLLDTRTNTWVREQDALQPFIIGGSSAAQEQISRSFFEEDLENEEEVETEEITISEFRVQEDRLNTEEAAF